MGFLSIFNIGWYDVGRKRQNVIISSLEFFQFSYVFLDAGIKDYRLALFLSFLTGFCNSVTKRFAYAL